MVDEKDIKTDPDDGEVRINRHDASEGEDVAEVTLTEDELRELCEKHICPECEVTAKADEDRLRAMADADNMRKRLERETEELRKFAAESVLADLLPVLDNLDLALAHGRGNQACKDFVSGVEMTRKSFLDTLRRHGLEAAGEKGEPFDPNVHEAVTMSMDPSLGDNVVAQVVQRGYSLKGRLLRPAKVAVNKLS